MKVSANFKKIIGKELDDQAEKSVKYYLVMTTFTCGRENFLELDGRSFESWAELSWADSELNLDKKVYLKLEKKLSQIVVGRSGQVHNVPTDLPKPLGTQIGWYMVAMDNADGGEVGRICCISAQI